MDNDQGLVVSFIGCSLDKNDASVFREYVERASFVHIYCYGFDDYKSKLTNLVNIFGSQKIECLLKNIQIVFYDIKNISSSTNTEPEIIVPSVYHAISLSSTMNELEEINQLVS